MSDIEKTLKIYRYWITLEDGDWSYIGKTGYQYQTQRCGGLQSGRFYQSCPKFWTAIQKYGFSSFNYEVLEKDLDSAEARVREEYWTGYFNSIEHGFNENNGHHPSKAVNQKRAEKLKKPILCFDSEGKFIAEFSSLKEAGEVLGLRRNHISECCAGNRKSVGGYTFQLK